MKTAELGKTQRRVAELDKIINRIFEEHVAGKLSDERFVKMLATYEAEQSQTITATQTLQAEIEELKSKMVNLKSFMKVVKQHGDITELTEETAQALIERIVVHEAVIKEGTKRVKESQQVDIYFTYIGQFNNE